MGRRDWRPSVPICGLMPRWGHLQMLAGKGRWIRWFSPATASRQRWCSFTRPAAPLFSLTCYSRCLMAGIPVGGVWWRGLT